MCWLRITPSSSKAQYFTPPNDPLVPPGSGGFLPLVHGLRISFSLPRLLSLSPFGYFGFLRSDFMPFLLPKSSFPPFNLHDPNPTNPHLPTLWPSLFPLAPNPLVQLQHSERAPGSLKPDGFAGRGIKAALLFFKTGCNVCVKRWRVFYLFFKDAEGKLGKKEQTCEGGGVDSTSRARNFFSPGSSQTLFQPSRYFEIDFDA